jgi:all-trans-retinol dehydrogenase (NAD+)
MRMETKKRGKPGIHWSSIHPSYLADGMFSGAKLGFLGNLILPLIKSHDVVAEAIVERAVKRGVLSPKRPYMLHLTPRLRGLMPDTWFQGFVRLLGVSGSMDEWKGRP